MTSSHLSLSGPAPVSMSMSHIPSPGHPHNMDRSHFTDDDDAPMDIDCDSSDASPASPVPIAQSSSSTQAITSNVEQTSVLDLSLPLKPALPQDSEDPSTKPSSNINMPPPTSNGSPKAEGQDSRIPISPESEKPTIKDGCSQEQKKAEASSSSATVSRTKNKTVPEVLSNAVNNESGNSDNKVNLDDKSSSGTNPDSFVSTALITTTEASIPMPSPNLLPGPPSFGNGTVPPSIDVLSMSIPRTPSTFTQKHAVSIGRNLDQLARSGLLTNREHNQPETVAPSEILTCRVPEVSTELVPPPATKEPNHTKRKEPSPLQSFARIEFADSIFEMTSYSVVIGRDVRALKQARRNEAEFAMRKGTVGGYDDNMANKKFSKSYVSEEGGMLGPESDGESSEHPNKRRRIEDSQERPVSNESPAVDAEAPNDLISDRQYVSHTPGSRAVDLDALRPSPDHVPFLGIHSPGPNIAQKTKAISRKHMMIKFNKEKHVFEAIALGRNGFFCDEVLYHDRVVLHHQAQLQIKDVLFTFLIPGAPPGATGAENLEEEQKPLNRRYSEGGKLMSLDFEARMAAVKEAQESDSELSDVDVSGLDALENRPEVPTPTPDEPPKVAGKAPRKSGKAPAKAPAPLPLLTSIDPLDPMAPPRRRGPGRPPKDGIMSKREHRERKKMLMEQERLKQAQETEIGSGTSIGLEELQGTSPGLSSLILGTSVSPLATKATPAVSNNAPQSSLPDSSSAQPEQPIVCEPPPSPVAPTTPEVDHNVFQLRALVEADPLPAACNCQQATPHTPAASQMIPLPTLTPQQASSSQAVQQQQQQQQQDFMIPLPSAPVSTSVSDSEPLTALAASTNEIPPPAQPPQHVPVTSIQPTVGAPAGQFDPVHSLLGTNAVDNIHLLQQQQQHPTQQQVQQTQQHNLQQLQQLQLQAQQIQLQAQQIQQLPAHIQAQINQLPPHQVQLLLPQLQASMSQDHSTLQQLQQLQQQQPGQIQQSLQNMGLDLSQLGQTGQQLQLHQLQQYQLQLQQRHMPMMEPEKRKVGRPRKHPLPDNADQTEKRKYKKRKSRDESGFFDGSDVERRNREKKEKRSRPKSPPLDLRKEDYTPEQLEKPNKNYSVLIDETLTAAGPEGLTLKQIYKRISTAYPWFYFHTETKGWESSVRHNLIGNEAFRKNEMTNTWSRVPGVELDAGKKRKTTTQDQSAFPLFQHQSYQMQYALGSQQTFSQSPQIQQGTRSGQQLYNQATPVIVAAQGQAGITPQAQAQALAQNNAMNRNVQSHTGSNFNQRSGVQTSVSGFGTQPLAPAPPRNNQPMGTPSGRPSQAPSPSNAPSSGSGSSQGKYIIHPRLQEAIANLKNGLTQNLTDAHVPNAAEIVMAAVTRFLGITPTNTPILNGPMEEICMRGFTNVVEGAIGTLDGVTVTYATPQFIVLNNFTVPATYGLNNKTVIEPRAFLAMEHFRQNLTSHVGQLVEADRINMIGVSVMVRVLGLSRVTLQKPRTGADSATTAQQKQVDENLESGLISAFKKVLAEMHLLVPSPTITGNTPAATPTTATTPALAPSQSVSQPQTAQTIPASQLQQVQQIQQTQGLVQQQLTVAKPQVQPATYVPPPPVSVVAPAQTPVTHSPPPQIVQHIQQPQQSTQPPQQPVQQQASQYVQPATPAQQQQQLAQKSVFQPVQPVTQPQAQSQPAQVQQSTQQQVQQLTRQPQLIKKDMLQGPQPQVQSVPPIQTTSSTSVGSSVQALAQNPITTTPVQRPQVISSNPVPVQQIQGSDPIQTLVSATPIASLPAPAPQLAVTSVAASSTPAVSASVAVPPSVQAQSVPTQQIQVPGSTIAVPAASAPASIVPSSRPASQLPVTNESVQNVATNIPRLVTTIPLAAPAVVQAQCPPPATTSVQSTPQPASQPDAVATPATMAPSISAIQNHVPVTQQSIPAPAPMPAAVTTTTSVPAVPAVAQPSNPVSTPAAQQVPPAAVDVIAPATAFTLVTTQVAPVISQPEASASPAVSQQPAPAQSDTAAPVITPVQNTPVAAPLAAIPASQTIVSSAPAQDSTIAAPITPVVAMSASTEAAPVASIPVTTPVYVANSSVAKAEIANKSSSPILQTSPIATSSIPAITATSGGSISGPMPANPPVPAAPTPSG